MPVFTKKVKSVKIFSDGSLTFNQLSTIKPSNKTVFYSRNLKDQGYYTELLLKTRENPDKLRYRNQNLK